MKKELEELREEIAYLEETVINLEGQLFAIRDMLEETVEHIQGDYLLEPLTTMSANEVIGVLNSVARMTIVPGEEYGMEW